jgi:hypothetical protein
MITLEKDDIIPIMDYKKVDVLTAGQLMIDDAILIADEVVSISDIQSLPDGYILEVVNDFGERDTIEVGEYDQFDLMMLE